MCGRYKICKPVSKTVNLVKTNIKVEDTDNYNAHPSQKLPIIKSYTNGKALELYEWGLVPGWSKKIEKFSPLINTRKETLIEKVTFKNLIQTSRCLVLADGYYEWKTTDSGKQPFFIKRSDDNPLYFGGLYQKNKVHEFTILTQESEGELRSIHHRMPLMLDESQFSEFFDYEKSVGILSREQSINLSFYKVSKQVNSPKNNKVELIKEI